MVPWRSYPVIRLLLPFMLGIVAADSTGPSGSGIPIALGTWLLAVLLQWARPDWMDAYSFRWFRGLLVQTIFFLAGHHMGSDVSLYQSYEHYAGLLETKDQVFVVEIADEPAEKGRSMVCTGVVRCLIKESSGPTRCHGRVRMVFIQPDTTFSLHYGDKLLVFSQPMPISGPDNPGAFDFRQYLSYRRVFHQFYLRQGDHTLVERGGSPLVALSIKTRLRLRTILEDREIRQQRLGLANAMLLGSKELIDADTLEGFSRAGAMHILCVSGLHVGIVYLMISVMLPKKFLQGKAGFFRPVLILAGIWGYAFLTGMSPSVQRAAVMFTMMSLGNHFRRSGSIFNNLAGSALLLMVVHPPILFYVGFQLSYLAVAGIALLEKPISSLLRLRWSPAGKLWRLMTVSLAAQAGTAPLAMHYFHAFPVYFLLTNLVVIPLSSLIIYAAVLLIALNPIDVASNFLARLLDQLLMLLDRSVDTIQSLPGAVIEPINPGMNGTVLLYLIMALCFQAVRNRNKKHLLLAYFSAFLLLASTYYAEFYSAGQGKMFIYKTRSSTAIDIIRGKRCVFLYDSGFLESGQKETYIAGGNRDALMIREIIRMEIDRKDKVDEDGLYFRFPLLVFQGISMLIVDDGITDVGSFPGGEGFDFLVILDCLPSTLDFLMQKVNVKEVILSSSLPARRVVTLREACSRAGIACWSVYLDGAREIISK